MTNVDGTVPPTADTENISEEMEVSLAKKIKIRGALRGAATKLRYRISERLEDGTVAVDIFYLKDKIQTIQQKIESLKKLDEEIIELMASCYDEEVEGRMGAEIEASDSVQTDLNGIVYRMEDALKQLSPPPSQQQMQSQGIYASPPQFPASSQPPKKTARLPKLEVKKFSGKIQEWQEFWDSFESAIDKNESLAAVDKFAYLRSLVVEPARSTIAGFSLTSANYTAAVEVLKKRYGKETTIQRAHVNDLLHLPHVFNDKDTPRLRKLYDSCESHFRGLKALGVDENTFSAVVVPAVLHKLPEAFRLTITRGTDFLSWSMEEMLAAFLTELELREDHDYVVTASAGSQDQKQGVFRHRDNRMRGGNATLHTRQDTENCCAFCLGKHAHENCTKVVDLSKRKDILYKFARCFKCLRKGHRVRECKSFELCNNCGQNHHISLCDSPPKPVTNAFEVGPVANPISASPSSLHVGTGGRVALQTACAVVSGEGEPRKVRVLFDAGSHRSFVTARVAQHAQLSVIRQDWLGISTFGQTSRDMQLRDVVQMKVSAVGGQKVIEIEAYVVPEISTIQNNHAEIAKYEYPHLKGLWFSDVSKGREEMFIDVLIGADYLWSFQKGCTIRGKPDEPVAVETELGWVLSGPMKSPNSESEARSVQVNLIGSCRKERVNLESDVHKLWDLETLGIIETEDEVHEAFVNSVSFTGNRYSVRLPWKEGNPELPSNYATSLRRLKTQVARLEKEPEVFTEYASIIEDQLEAGIIERVFELEKAPKVHYLPHQAVIRKESTTTKVRVVYDASSREGKTGTSLNDCLHVGPSLNPLLYNILLRFRENRVVLVGDIEKAFLNVEVDVQDRDCLRFLWMEKPPDLSHIVVYRFCRVVFGVNASPFLLNATIRHHIKKYEECDPGFVQRLLDSFYVDDLVGGGAKSTEVVELYRKTSDRMADGGFNLRKWLTNDPQVRAKIETDAKVDNGQVKVSEEDLTYAKSSVGMQLGCKGQKVLGLAWDYEADVISFDLTEIADRAKGLPATKRNTLRLLAGIFDPLGIMGPVTVSAKIMFQDVCRQKSGWDDPLQGEVKRGVEGWIKGLIDCQKIMIHRCVWDHVREEVVQCSLHGFADASKKAYCAVIYLVYTTSTGIYTRMLTSKTRVAPLKELSIPRLELMSALMLARLMSTVEKALSHQAGVKRSRLWLDSMTALFWIMNRGEWKQFVRHRVNEVLKLSEKGDWSHCPGEENPADIGSRGVSALELKQSELWWHGPAWSLEREDSWPTVKAITPTSESSEEERKAAVMTVQVDTPLGLDRVVEINRYSCTRTLLRVTAWVKRFCFNIKKRKEERKREALTLQELSEAENDWIRVAQKELTQDDNYKQLVGKFGLSEDCNGVLRCKGRLEYSDLPPDAKEPIILPKDHRLTYLQIQQCHKRVLHSGVRGTLAELRSRFWVPKGRQVVKKVLSQCVVCKKFEGTPFAQPPVSSLPEFRVRPAPPFSKVGVDFAGPLYVKTRGKQMRKVYIALFSCCVTRALYLDLVEDLSATTFLRCLRKFTARMGTPTLIVSDNAKTFKRAEKELRTLYRHPEVRAELESRRIEWRFNLEKAPWWGGFFERMVGSVKRCLNKVIGNARLTYDELLTVLVEVESTLNSRPLTYEYNSPEGETLTPAHLIYGRRLQSLPEVTEEEDESESTCTRRYKYLNQKLQHFWKRWQREYLTDLRESHRMQGSSDGKSPKVGDIVTVYKEGTKRGSWKLAVLEGLIAGKDKEVRGAIVRVITKGKQVRISRPVQRLFPLEVRAASQENTRANEGVD